MWRVRIERRRVRVRAKLVIDLKSRRAWSQMEGRDKEGQRKTEAEEENNTGDVIW